MHVTQDRLRPPRIICLFKILLETTEHVFELKVTIP
jgi:hypothetical protein